MENKKKNYSPKPFPLPFLDDEQTKIFYEILEKEGKLRVPGLGDFSLRQINSRWGWNPAEGKKMIIPGYVKIHFKADPKFSKYFNK